MSITGHHVARRVPAMPVDGPSLPLVGEAFTLVRALDALERWQRQPSEETRAEVARALEGIVQSAAARGALLEVSAPPLPIPCAPTLPSPLFKTYSTRLPSTVRSVGAAPVVAVIPFALRLVSLPLPAILYPVMVRLAVFDV